MGHDCKRKKPTDKNPAPTLHRASGNGASPFLFAFSTLALENVGKRERGRNSLPSRRAEIPFFVGAVNQNTSLRCLIAWATTQFLTSVQVNQGNRWVKREIRQFPDAHFISLRGCIFFFFLQPFRRHEVVHSPQLFKHLTDAWGEAWWRGALQMLHPVTCPRGVSHECSGSRLSISYLCVTYQSCLQPEKAITERRPLAFVRPHSSPANNPNTTSNPPPPPANLRLPDVTNVSRSRARGG